MNADRLLAAEKTKSARCRQGQPSFDGPQPLPQRSGPARQIAERHWDADLRRYYLADVELYGRVIAAIDPGLQAAATDAELRRRGAGALHIVAELEKRGMEDQR